MSDKKYLVQRRQGWYVQVRVPDSLYHIMGKRKIVRSLHTSSLEEARSRRWEMVKKIKAVLDEAKRQLNDSPAPGTPEGIITYAKQVRREADLGLYGDPENALEGELVGLDIQAENYFSPSGRSARGIALDPDTGYREDPDPEMVAAFQLAKGILTPGSDAVMLLASQALDDHLEEISQRVRVQTKNARKRRVKAFLGWLGGDKQLVSISRRDAGRYLTEKLMKMGRSVKTVRDTLSDLSAFFNWCVDRGMIDINPFQGLSQSVRDTSRGTKDKTQRERRPFSTDELKAYLDTIKKNLGTDDPVWAVTVIAMFTGMRPEEICEIELTDVHADYVHIPEAKTESSVRDVPMHPLIKPLVKRLVEKSRKGKDNYLLRGLKRGGEDDKRWQNLGKRARYQLREKTGITDKRVVFYSLRKNFSTAMENASIPESTAQQIVGHKKQSMTYGLYSNGVDLKVLSDAVQKVSYGDEIAALVSK
ncbi:MAG: tyrosine-type recombinase/integrase [Candidatus Sedimenticola sp. (ex Thyasira tokunagai)]